MRLNFKSMFDDYVASHQKVWQHDRSQSVGASEAFGCLRKAWFSKHPDYPKDEDREESWGALQRGDMIENHFVEPIVNWWLKTKHPTARLAYGGKRQRTLVDTVSRLSATPDGLVTNADDDALAEYGIPSLGGTGCFNFEIKSIDPRVSLKEEKAIHNGQVQVQMGLTREKTRFKPNYAVIIYIDASFFDDIDIFIVQFSTDAYAAAKTRSRSVFEIKNVSDILPEGKIDGSCQYCPYKRACSIATGLATPTDGESNESDLPSALSSELEALISEERALSSEEKAIKEERAEASERLKQQFRELGVRRLQVGPFKASITWVKGRKTLDVEAMRADGVNVDKYYTQGNGYDMLRISEIGPQTSEAEATD